MPSAEIITIGTELLLGEIQDTNTRYLARFLRNLGIDIFRATIVGDNVNRISQAIQELLMRSDIIITTGGLGPTVDDPTRYAVAQSLGVDTEFRPELWDQIQERFRKYGRTATENNRQQALVPQGAIAITNPVGTAPAFIVDTGPNIIICVPGVPREMEYLLDNEVGTFLKSRFHLTSIIQARVVHTAGVGESQIDEWVADLERLSNPTVGLLAHPGQTDIRVTAKAESQEMANVMINKVVGDLETRIGEHIYGFDDETLEGLIISKITTGGIRLAVIECNMNGSLIKRFENAHPENLAVLPITQPLENRDLLSALIEFEMQHNSDLALGVTIHPHEDAFRLYAIIIKGGREQIIDRAYGGPPSLVYLWASNTVLDFLRRNLNDK